MKHNNLLKKMMASAVAFSMMAGSLPLMPAADEAVVQSEILPETSGPQTDAPASSQGTSGSETQVLPSQDSKLESQDSEQSGSSSGTEKQSESMSSAGTETTENSTSSGEQKSGGDEPAMETESPDPAHSEASEMTENGSGEMQETDESESGTETVTEETTDDSSPRPAITFDRQTLPDGSYVDVTAPDGAFPEGTSLTVTLVDARTVIEKAEEATGIDTLTADNIAAYDFDFYRDDEHNLEPEKEIQVSFHRMDITGSDDAADLSVYHVDDQTGETVQVDENKVTDVSVSGNTADAAIQTDQFSTYFAVLASTGKTGIWINDAVTTKYSTLKEAVEAASEGDTIHVNGVDASAVNGAAVNKNLTLDICGNTTLTGSGSDTGFTIASGSKIQTSGGAVLTMTGYGKALTIADGAVMADGTYEFSDVNTGLDLKGRMEGTSQDALKVTIRARKNSVGLDTGNNTSFKNVTLTWNGGGQDGWTYRNMTFDNSRVEISGVWLYPYPLTLNSTYFRISGRFGGNSWRGGHVLSIYEKPGVLNNSTMVVDGSRVNVINADGLTLNNNSSITVQNSPDGGFNVNYGSKLVLNDSTIKAENVSRGFVAAGYDEQSNLYINGSSTVETAASGQADSVGVNGEFVVTGGSYKIYEPQLSRDTQLIPTNGADNGNEKLTLFHLADPGITELKPINKNGENYIYPVARANEDGQKRVWAPAAAVTYKLNNGNAVFDDKTSGDKIFRTIRGYSLSAVAGFEAPGNPTDSTGVKFCGWYYKNDQGEEIAFDPDTVIVTKDLEVYAKWDSHSIIYHNGSGESYIQEAASDQYLADVLTFDEIVKKDEKFKVPGKTFVSWNTAADGSGLSYHGGDQVSFTGDRTQIDLYAQYNTLTYKVSFSAGGGTFSDGSIYKNSSYFTIETDAGGGETAVLKQTALYGQTLHDLTSQLGLDYNELKPDVNATFQPYGMNYTLSDKQNWYTSADGGESIHFDDQKKSFWGFTYTDYGENPAITSDLTYYLKWKDSISEQDQISANSNISADMWSVDTDSTAVKTVKPGENVYLSGAVDVSSIQSQIKTIAEQFKIEPEKYENIKLVKPSCIFTADITLPDGIDAENVSVSAEGYDSCFELEPVRVSEYGKKTITIKFTLKDGITDFKKLYDAVNGTGTKSLLGEKTIKMTIAGLTVKDDAKVDEMLTAVGNVSGHFESAAFYKTVNETDEANETDAASEGTAKKFVFSWGGVQEEKLKDSANSKSVVLSGAKRMPARAAVASSSGISASFLPYKPLELTLPGDMTTEGAKDSRAIRPVLEGDELTFIGQLDVSTIKQRIMELGNDYTQPSDIGLKDVASTFTAEFTLPAELSMPEDVSGIALEGGSGLFEIDREHTVRTDAQHLTVRFKLKGNYSNYDALNKAVQAVDDILAVRVAKVKVAENIAGNTNLTSSGRLKGDFFAIATYPTGDSSSKSKVFAFNWTGVQSTDDQSLLKNGKDEAQSADDNETIAYTVGTPQLLELPGDILAGSDTEHEQVYPALKGDTLDLTGALDVASIKASMAAIESQYPNSKPDQIALTDKEGNPGVTFGFTLTAEFPNGLSVPSDMQAQVQDGSFGDFEIESTVISGQTVTVTFGISKASAITNYAALQACVNSAGGSSVMKIRFPGIRVTGDGQMTVKAKLKGSFMSYASSNGNVKSFAFRWDAVQSADKNSNALGDGSDYISPGSSDISFTVKTVVPENLPADILINEDTEHDAVYAVRTGDKLTYSADIDVTGIQNKMKEIEEDAGTDSFSEIALSNLESRFTATFAIPEELAGVWPKDKGSYTLKGTEAFSVVNVSVMSGQAVVTMALKDGIENYQQLHEAVIDQTQSTLRLDIGPFPVPDSIRKNTNITVTGDLSGYMRAAASLNGHVRNYAFAWNASQNKGPDGTDAIHAENPSTPIISGTIIVKDRETESETKPETEPETKPETEPETKPGTEPETKPETEPETKPGSKPETKPSASSPESSPASAKASTADVKTGDTTPLAVWIGILAAAAVLIIILVIVKKKSAKKS